MAVVLAVVGLFVYHLVANELLRTVDQTLLGQAREELGTHRIDAEAEGGATLAQLYAHGGRLLAVEPSGLSPMLDRRQLLAARTRRLWLNEQLQLHGRRSEWRVLALSRNNGQIAVVARSLAPRAESLDHLRHELLIFLPLALLAACCGGYALTAGALRPVEALRRRAEAVTAGEPAELPAPPSEDEIHRLAVTLNDMLARLHSAFEHERRFVADASHELRTPLALLQTELDLALRRPRTHEELERALRSAAEETQRLVRLAEDLLLIARADQEPLPIRREEVDADELLADVASRFATRAHILGRKVRVEASGLRVNLDARRVEQALGNLLENALDYGQGTIELHALDAGQHVELHAIDEGRGFPDQFRERAFDRFSRADEARSGGGSGLGLAIVELVARAHGGGVGARNRPQGGADVWLSVPKERVAGEASTANAVYEVRSSP
jgi:two-component system, OmpR family, sensor kinase